MKKNILLFPFCLGLLTTFAQPAVGDCYQLHLIGNSADSALVQTINNYAIAAAPGVKFYITIEGVSLVAIKGSATVEQVKELHRQLVSNANLVNSRLTTCEGSELP